MKMKRNEANVVRAAIYARYSSKNQVGDSADTQISRVKRKVADGRVRSRLHPDREIVVDDDWVRKDEAKSGTTVGRADYKKILHGIENEMFDVLLVDDLSRLTRDLGDMIDLYELARFYQVEVVSISDGVSSADESAKAAFTLKGIVNDLANDAHRARVLSRMENHFQDGFSTGQLPYGYTSSPTRSETIKGRLEENRFKIEIHPERAEIVVRIFEMAAEGIGRRRITATLNEELVLSPSKSHRKDGPRGMWRESSVNRILNNEKYIGDWVWRKTSHIKNPTTGLKEARGNQPRDIIRMRPEIAETLRIVPQELWDRVAARRERVKSAQARARNEGERIFGDRLGKRAPDHMLAGLLHCSDCGATYIRVSGKGGGRYGCREAHQGSRSCPNRSSIDAQRLETAILDALEKTLTQRDLLMKLASEINAGIASAKGHTTEDRASISKELKRIDHEIKNLVSFITQGNGQQFSSVAEALANTERRKRDLEEKLRGLSLIEAQTEKVTPDVLRPRIGELLSRLARKPQIARKALTNLFPRRIAVKQPKNVKRDPWRLDLTIDGGNMLFLNPLRRQAEKSSVPETTKPSEGHSEGPKFGELSNGSP